MREYSVSLRKSEFAVASDAPMNTCAPGKAQGSQAGRDRCAVRNHKGVKKEYENEVKKEHDIGVKNDYINEVKKEPNNEVKKEPDNEDSAPDMDVGRNMKLKQNPLTVMSSDEVQENDFIIKKEDKVFEVTIKQELDVGPTVLQPRPIRRRRGPARVRVPNDAGTFDSPVTSSLRVKVEDHHYENSREGYVDSNYWQVSNTGLYVGERTSQESAFRSMEAQMEGQCTYCMEVLKHYECRTNIPNNTYTDGQKYECEYCGFTTNIDVDFVKSIRSRMNKKS
ncbi:hypothetical protein EVAR_86175_1 [Eumeta japonica]|uniref:Uncharacterized protein n=1 Tax=Eumeta variegata TaxID=151549 RepID=A0A4C2A379_EUMVA|nr:hypothetical protein EVAR_86175_1 [Eumeta japonica]